MFRLVTRQRTNILLFSACIALSVALLGASHIEDTNGELSNFSWDRVVFRVQKDCGLDKIPEVSITLHYICDEEKK